jgi:hypothetical protein
MAAVAVEVLAAEGDDQDLDPAAAALSKSRQLVLVNGRRNLLTRLS